MWYSYRNFLIHSLSKHKWLIVIIKKKLCSEINYKKNHTSQVLDMLHKLTKIRLFMFLQALMQLAGHYYCNRCIRSLATFTKPIKALEKCSSPPVIATISVNPGKRRRNLRYCCNVLQEILFFINFQNFIIRDDQFYEAPNISGAIIIFYDK